MEKPNIHPEMAEPLIDQLILYYVWAGLRVGLQPDWTKFRTSSFYKNGCEHFKQDEFDRRLVKAEAMTHFPDPENYGAPGTATDRVIRDYVNIGMALGMPPNWEEFRDSQFFDACVEKFTAEAVEKAITQAKGPTDLLNKPLGDLGLPPGFFGKK